MKLNLPVVFNKRIGNLFVVVISFIIIFYLGIANERNTASGGEVDSVYGVRWDFSELTNKNVMWRHKIGDDSGPITLTEKQLLIGLLASDWAEKPKNNRGIIQCLDRKNGKHLWSISHKRLSHPANDNHTIAIRSKPVVDGEMVYYHSNRGEIVCATLTGLKGSQKKKSDQIKHHPSVKGAHIVWKLDMVAGLGVFKRDAGVYGNPIPSPVILNDMVYCVTNNGSILGYSSYFTKFSFVPKEKAPSFIAVDKKSGKVVWKSNLPGKNIIHGQWASPVIVPAAGGHQIIFPGGSGVLYSLNPKNGKLLWQVDCNAKGATKWSKNRQGISIGTRAGFVASPILHNENLYAITSMDMNHDEKVQREVYCISSGAKGETAGVVKWKFNHKLFDGSVTTPVAHNGIIYVLSKSGRLFALDAKIGQLLWMVDSEEDISRSFASLVIFGDKLFVPFEDKLAVLRVGRRKQVVGHYSTGGRMYGTPAITKDVIYLASKAEIIAIKRVD